MDSTPPSRRSRPKLPKLAHTSGFTAIGTAWEIDSREPLPAAVLAAVEQRCESFDRTYSRFRDDSLVARIAATPGRFEFPHDAPSLFDLYRRLYEATGGAVSPLVGAALENLGYDRGYSLRQAAPAVRVPAWDDAFGWDGTALTTLRPAVVDVGAAGKGYLVDLVAEVLHDHGVDEFTIDASGDIRHSSAEPLRVGLEHPLDTSKAIGVATLRTGALASSATNRRAWGDLHHVIDVTTGLPTRNVIATWAIAETALLADGLATALFFAGEELTASFDFEFVRMFATGRVESSAGFEGELFA